MGSYNIRVAFINSLFKLLVPSDDYIYGEYSDVIDWEDKGLEDWIQYND